MLKEKVLNLPTTPGVYLMKDTQNQTIYVGKAKNLKRRVQSYFQNSKNHSSKTLKLIHQIKDFEYILTDTEFEAFLLECKLIHDIKPYFNRKMKNPLSYTYIVINTNKGFRKIDVRYQLENVKENSYYGPFLNKNTAQRAINGMLDFLKIHCLHPGNSISTCLNYGLGSCIGMCQGGSVLKEYDKGIDRIIALLNGTSMELMEEINERMHMAASQFDFENAAKYRDLAIAVHSLNNQEKVIEFAEKNRKIIVLDKINEEMYKIFFISGNQVLFCQKQNLLSYDLEPLIEKLFFEIANSYKHDSEGRFEIRKEDIDEAHIIYHYLKNNQSRFFIIEDNWIKEQNLEKIRKEFINLMQAYY